VGDPLVVGTLWPKRFPAASFVESTGDVARPVEIRSAYYQESPEARGLRRSRRPADELRGLLPELTDDVRSVLAEAEVLFTLDIPDGIGELAPRLRWIQAIGAGVFHFDLDQLAAADVTLTTAAGASAVAIAEFTLARMLQALKALRAYDEFQQQRVWATPEQWWNLADGRLLEELTLGVVGLGQIGQAVAQRAHALGMRVVANRRRPGRLGHPDYVDELYGPDGLDRVLEQADVLVLAAAETEGTMALIGRREFELLPAGALFCNVARGTLVDETAMAEALTSGRLGGALLDVTAVEPLPPESPLWSTPNTYISPHSASSHDKMIEHTVELFADNLRRYLAGETLRNLVDQELGY